MRSPSLNDANAYSDTNDGFGWKAFAAFMLVIAGSINLIQGLVAITKRVLLREPLGRVASAAPGDRQDLDLGLDPAHLGSDRVRRGLRGADDRCDAVTVTRRRVRHRRQHSRWGVRRVRHALPRAVGRTVTPGPAGPPGAREAAGARDLVFDRARRGPGAIDPEARGEGDAAEL